MSKLKTRKSAVKRFKVTGTGKIIRRRAYNNHMFFHKGGSQKRRLDQETELSRTEVKRVRRMLAL
jgi:large subunit ribosomal protein L35